MTKEKSQILPVCFFRHYVTQQKRNTKKNNFTQRRQRKVEKITNPAVRIRMGTSPVLGRWWKLEAEDSSSSCPCPVFVRRKNHRPDLVTAAVAGIHFHNFHIHFIYNVSCFPVFFLFVISCVLGGGILLFWVETLLSWRKQLLHCVPQRSEGGSWWGCDWNYVASQGML